MVPLDFHFYSKCTQMHYYHITAVAPAAGTKIDEGIFEFCAFFLNSCTPALRTACQDLLRLDF